MKILVIHPKANMNIRFSYKINKIKPFLFYLLQLMFRVNPLNSISTRCSFGRNTVKIHFYNLFFFGSNWQKGYYTQPKEYFSFSQLGWHFKTSKIKFHHFYFSIYFLFLLILKLINLFDFGGHYHYNPFYYLNTGLHLINMAFQLIHSSAFLSSGDNNIRNKGITFSKNFKMFLHLH